MEPPPPPLDRARRRRRRRGRERREAGAAAAQGARVSGGQVEAGRAAQSAIQGRRLAELRRRGRRPSRVETHFGGLRGASSAVCRCRRSSPGCFCLFLASPRSISVRRIQRRPAASASSDGGAFGPETEPQPSAEAQREHGEQQPRLSPAKEEGEEGKSQTLAEIQSRSHK